MLAQNAQQDKIASVNASDNKHQESTDKVFMGSFDAVKKEWKNLLQVTGCAENLILFMALIPCFGFYR